MLLFAGGLFVGAFFGVLVTAMCAAAARGDVISLKNGRH